MGEKGEMKGPEAQHEGMAEPNLRDDQTATSGVESQGNPHLYELLSWAG